CFHAGDGIRDFHVTGVQTCALPISRLGGEPVAENPWPTPPTEEEKAERKAQRATQKAASANSPSTPSEPEDTRKFGDILSAIDEIGRASWRERADRWVRAGTVEQVH